MFDLWDSLRLCSSGVIGLSPGRSTSCRRERLIIKELLSLLLRQCRTRPPSPWWHSDRWMFKGLKCQTCEEKCLFEGNKEREDVRLCSVILYSVILYSPLLLKVTLLHFMSLTVTNEEKVGSHKHQHCPRENIPNDQKCRTVPLVDPLLQ